MKKLLITGASGFIGGFIVDKALSEGLEVHCVVRSTSSRKYLSDSRIKFLQLNLRDKSELTTQISTLKAEEGVFDYVIHNAGITKANKNSEFFEVNAKITERLIDALISTDIVKEKFVFISSLAAAGPGKSIDEPIKIDQTPNPVTSYGKSKLQAENYLKQAKGLPYIILRPTAVFGPRDTELFTLFSLVSKGLEFYIGTDAQRLSFIYVKDLVEMLFAALEAETNNKTYYLSDGKNYLIREFVSTIKTAMDKKTFKAIIPVSLVGAIAFILEKTLGVFGKVPALNSEKMAELTSLNWTCDMQPYFTDITIRPKYNLQDAVSETVDWYKNENWI